MSDVEFSRPFRIDTIGTEPRTVSITADVAERTALAARFGLIGIARLEAEAVLRREGTAVYAKGRLRAQAAQACVATGDPVPARVEEAFSLRFDPAGDVREELELDEADLDSLSYEGGAIDLGEAVAQEFVLALDPFPRAPHAEERLRAAGVLSEEEIADARRETNPFSALKGLKRD